MDDDHTPSQAPPFFAELRRRQCEIAKESLHDFVSRHTGAGCEIDEVIELGKPHREILRTASERGADLIVMGVRGRGPVDLTLFGSTTNQIVRRATCPVVTLRSR
jgi:nucleotide-binding universal stress UspA family protein